MQNIDTFLLNKYFKNFRQQPDTIRRVKRLESRYRLG